MSRTQSEPLAWLERLNAAREQVDAPADGELPAPSEVDDPAAVIARERAARVRAEQRADHLASLAVKERDARLAAEEAAEAAQAEAREARCAAWEAVRRRDEQRRRRSFWRRGWLGRG